MARIYRTKVTELAKALQEPESRCEATEALRGLVDAIVLTPDQDGKTLRIELTWLRGPATPYGLGAEEARRSTKSSRARHGSGPAAGPPTAKSMMLSCSEV